MESIIKKFSGTQISKTTERDVKTELRKVGIDAEVSCQLSTGTVLVTPKGGRGVVIMMVPQAS